MVNAVSYNVRYKKSTASTWTNTTSLTNSKDLSGLSRNTSYEFQVQSVCSGGGSSDYSFSYKFATYSTDPPTSLSKPTLVSPTDGQINVPANATVSWQQVTGANAYVILYSETSDFSSCLIISTNGLSYTLSGLKENIKYYWKVKGIFNYFSGPWSDIRSFNTAAFEAIPPVLRSPIDRQMGVSVNPSFYWYTAVGCSYYNLEYSKNSSFSPSVTLNELYGTTKSITGLTPKTTYYWRMNAMYGDFPSPWSETWSFKTVNSGKFSIPEANEVAGENASLSFNPNPFSSLAHCSLEVFEQDIVSIDITDIFGRKIASLINEFRNPGTYEFDFDASSIPAGVYYCHLIVGNEIQTLKMVVMK
jgi:hypothetical protein